MLTAGSLRIQLHTRHLRRSGRILSHSSRWHARICQTLPLRLCPCTALLAPCWIKRVITCWEILKSCQLRMALGELVTCRIWLAGLAKLAWPLTTWAPLGLALASPADTNAYNRLIILELFLTQSPVGGNS